MSKTPTTPPEHPLKNGNGSFSAKLNHFFSLFATQTSRLSGSPITFSLAVLIIVVWAITGPLFHFSDTWQLVINTGTTIVTFLMVFLIQNTQNRDSIALHLKIDELIRANKRARNALIDMEDLTQDELEQFKERFVDLAKTGRDISTDRIQELIDQTQAELKSRKQRHTPGS